MLASFISRRMNEVRSCGLICKSLGDENVEEHRDPLVLLKTVIFPIASKRKPLWRLVREAFKIGGFKFFSHFDALWNLLLQIDRAEKKYSITVIIDAMDELEQAAQHRVISM